MNINNEKNKELVNESLKSLGNNNIISAIDISAIDIDGNEYNIDLSTIDEHTDYIFINSSFYIKKNELFLWMLYPLTSSKQKGLIIADNIDKAYKVFWNNNLYEKAGGDYIADMTMPYSSQICKAKNVILRSFLSDINKYPSSLIPLIDMLIKNDTIEIYGDYNYKISFNKSINKYLENIDNFYDEIIKKGTKENIWLYIIDPYTSSFDYKFFGFVLGENKEDAFVMIKDTKEYKNIIHDEAYRKGQHSIQIWNMIELCEIAINHHLTKKENSINDIISNSSLIEKCKELEEKVVKELTAEEKIILCTKWMMENLNN